MPQPVNTKELARKKYKLKDLYIQVIRIENGVDCGRSLLMEISPEYRRLNAEMDALLKECKAMEGK